MLKAIAFDLDGVLVDCKDLHYHALNAALEKVAGKEFVIGYPEHLKKFDALPTSEKLKILTKERGLKPSLHGKIWQAKQDLTAQEAVKLPKDLRLKAELEQLAQKFSLYVASNSIRASIEAILTAAGVRGCFGDVLSCEQVSDPKPHPAIYLELLYRHGLGQSEMLIVEDSDKGVKSAQASGCPYIRVKNSQEVSYSNLCLSQIKS